MDMKLKNGTIVHNVPAGVTQEAVERFYADFTAGKAGAPAPEMELPSTTIARQEAAKYAGSLLPKSGKVEDMNPLLQGVGGAKAAWDQAAYGVKGLIPGVGLTPQERELLLQGRSFIDQTGPASTAGEFLANAGMTVAPSVRGAQGAAWLSGRMLPRALQGAGTAAGTVGADAMIGAAVSPENRIGGAIGGAVGSALGLGSRYVADNGLVGPWVKQPARELMDRGIQPTVGQAVGGVLNEIEQKAASLPIVGGAVRRARNRANDEYVGETARGVLPPNRRAPLPDRGVGDRAVFAVQDRIRGMYDEAFNNFPPEFTVNHGDIATMTELAATRPDRVMRPEDSQRVRDAVQQIILNRPPTLTPEAAKQIESQLGAAVRNTINSADAADRQVGQALLDIRNAWHESLTGIGDAGGARGGSMLRDADNSYRAFLPLDLAASKPQAQNAAVTSEAGRFTPRLFRRAIEGVDTSVNNRQSRRVAAGLDPYEHAPGTPWTAAQPEPTFTPGERTPWGTVPGTDMVPAGGGGFDFGGQPALARAGGEVGPVRPGELGPAASAGGELGPVLPGGGQGGAAPREAFTPEGLNLPETPPGSRFDANNRLTRAAEEVIPDYMPDSGTAGRLFALGGAAGLAKVGGLPLLAGAYGLGMPLAFLGASRPVQRLLTQGAASNAERNLAYGLRQPLFGAGIEAGRDNIGAPTPEDDARLLRELGMIKY